jgi:hypothetical protein
MTDRQGFQSSYNTHKRIFAVVVLFSALFVLGFLLPRLSVTSLSIKVDTQLTLTTRDGDRN